MSKSSSTKPITKSIIQTTSSNTSALYEDILEFVFLCTVEEESSNSSSSLVYLAELAASHPTRWDRNRLDQALFERAQISDCTSQLVPTTTKNSSIADEIVKENRCLYYLSGCYQRLSRRREHFKSILDEIQMLLIDYSKTAIIMPDIYQGQDLSKQYMELLIESQNDSLLCEYTDRVNNELTVKIVEETKSFYRHVFRYMYQCIQPLDYFANEMISYMMILKHLAQWPVLVQIIFQISHPKSSSNRSARNFLLSSVPGRAFEDTLIGSVLSKSCLPSMHGKPFLFFEKPKSMSDRDIEITAMNMWQPMQIYQEAQCELFKAFVKNSDVRNDVLEWIGDCLYQNQGKNKEWSAHDPLTAFLFVSDGFLLNLNMILLNLARPFAEPYSPRLLKIDPLYVVTENAHVHLKELNKQTPMIKREVEEKNSSETTFHFITEIFFMAHFCYSCSVHRIDRILSKINDEFPRIRDAYNDVVNTLGSDHESAQRLDAARDKLATIFFNFRAVLNEPRLLELSNALFTATSSWLVHLAVSTHDDPKTNTEEHFNRITKLPLSKEPNRQLSYIPEFIMENIVNYVIFLGGYNRQFFETIGSSINEYVNLILVFMGDASRLRNPHLRATLAEALEVILPQKDNSSGRTLNSAFAEAIFKEHPLIEHLPRVLLDVFVSIELTGQAVAFEQKFSYRRPMYDILEYLWTYDKQRAQVKKLADHAERHIDDAEAPLFLRFINLLMNDANYLLDEALSHMASLKASQEAKERGDWKEMPEKQREELESSFRRNGRIARYMNIMGIKTLTIVNMITSDIQSIFCHPAICERLGAMLNYFLQHLVGPKRRNLKVRDLNEYLFDPQKLVAKVTDIYLNFAKYDQFCAAVSNDGMSYNDQLFPQAVEVLKRIGHSPERINAFVKLGEHVKEIAAQQKEDDAVYDDAPDEYLDPITDILMNDPVMLPSSRKIVDRSTISRHLLSDQTDPFNRNPLHMQDVIPQNELKETIEQWKASQRRK